MSNREPLVVQGYGSNQRHLQSEASVLDPGRLLRILRRHWLWLIVPPILLGAAGGALASRQDSRYEATTIIALQPTAAQDRLSGDRSNALAEREIKTEEQLLNGRAMTALIRTNVGRGIEFEANAIEGTDLIELAVVAGDPQGAALAADLVADLYIQQRRTRIDADLETAASGLRDKVAELERELAGVDTALEGSSPSATGLLLDSQAALAEADPALLRQRSQLERELSLTEASLEQLLSEVALTNGDVRIAAAAIPPNDRISPNPVRSGVLWAMLGVLIGLGLVWMRDLLDRRIRITDDLSQLGDELDFAGRIPKPDTSLLSGPASMLIEEVADRFRVLASNSLRTREESLSVQVTGVRGGAGSTFVAANLAATLAAGGWATVVVDADLADGDLHGVFGVESRPGLKQLLNGDSLAGVVQATRQVHGLGVVARGSKGVSDATLHNSTLPELLRKLADRFDVVIVDSPPILHSGDASVLAHYVDKTILVAALNETTRPELELATASVLNSGGRVSAIALTEPSRSVISAAVRSITMQTEIGSRAVDGDSIEAMAAVTGSHMRRSKR